MVGKRSFRIGAARIRIEIVVQDNAGNRIAFDNVADDSDYVLPDGRIPRIQPKRISDPVHSAGKLTRHMVADSGFRRIRGGSIWINPGMNRYALLAPDPD